MHGERDEYIILSSEGVNGLHVAAVRLTATVGVVAAGSPSLSSPAVQRHTRDRNTRQCNDYHRHP